METFATNTVVGSNLTTTTTTLFHLTVNATTTATVRQLHPSLDSRPEGAFLPATSNLTSSAVSAAVGGRMSDRQNVNWSDDIRLPFCILILFLAVTGNGLVIVTLIQNKKMRTVTNVFLLNLSISDLLLAVFCMPFTLIPALLKTFIFGETVCVLIRYLQGVSVSVSCFTLVAISLERYFAVCRPLQSRTWRTLSHACLTIAICWVLSGVVTIPIGTYTKLKSYHSVNKCREVWTSDIALKVYTISLNHILLLFPMIVMSIAYGLIMKMLWKGLQIETQIDKDTRNGISHTEEGETSSERRTEAKRSTSSRQSSKTKDRFEYGKGIRQSNSEKSRTTKLRVIRMLFVIVIEFFICWSPLYIVQTWIVFDEKGANESISPTCHSFIQLLAYVSSCCNPITYCFMNNKFRQGFVTAFRCVHTVHPRLARRPERSVSTYSGSTRTAASRVLVYDKMQVSEDIIEKRM